MVPSCMATRCSRCTAMSRTPRILWYCLELRPLGPQCMASHMPTLCLTASSCDAHHGIAWRCEAWYCVAPCGAVPCGFVLPCIPLSSLPSSCVAWHCLVVGIGIQRGLGVGPTLRRRLMSCIATCAIVLPCVVLSRMGSTSDALPRLALCVLFASSIMARDVRRCVIVWFCMMLSGNGLASLWWPVVDCSVLS